MYSYLKTSVLVCEFQYWQFMNPNPFYKKQISHFQMLYFCDNDNVMIPN